MKELVIRLTRGKTTVVDALDFPVLSRVRWTAAEKRGHFYAQRTVGPRADRHVEIMARVILSAPKGLIVDHRNGDTLDNRRHNLRLCTRLDNQHNIHARRSKSGFKGVARVVRRSGAAGNINDLRKPWIAMIRCAGKAHYLGYHETAAQAARAYDEAAKRLHGEFANLNFPDGTK